jgi:hypothetical protein
MPSNLVGCRHNIGVPKAVTNAPCVLQADHEMVAQEISLSSALK